MRKVAAIAAALVALVSCRSVPDSQSKPASEKPAPGVVARLGDLDITVADVDAHILSLPPAQRPKPGQDLDSWYDAQIREVAVDHRLRADAKAKKLSETPVFRAARGRAKQEATVALCVAKLHPDAAKVTDAALHEFYDANRKALAAPERRNVYNIFLRRKAGESTAALRARMAKLRDRVLDGQNFQVLASANSDAESRHQQGSLGWIKRGQYPPVLEKIIFGLQEGVPSEPIVTRDGAHLFYVDQVLKARDLTFDEARHILQERLLTRQRERALNEIEKLAKPPAGAVLTDRDAFVAALKAGDPKATLLKIGDDSLTLEGLRRETRQAMGRQSQGKQLPPVDLAWQLLHAQQRRDLVVGYCTEQHVVPKEELEKRLDTWSDGALLSLERQRRMVKLAKSDAAQLEVYYKSNIGRFSTPPTWQLHRLQVPLGKHGEALMAQLEAAAKAHPVPSLEALQSKLGGKIDDLGKRTLTDLEKIQPKLPSLVAPLHPGELSAPYQTEKGLEIVQCQGRQAAQALPFEKVRDRVAAAYVKQYTHKVYKGLAEEIMKSAKLKIFPQELEALRKAGLPQPDITVDQLEKALESH